MWWVREKSENATVYISYARQDGGALAKRLQRDLSKAGLKAWLDKREGSGGGSWTAEIEAMLGQVEVVVALLTAGSYASEVCRAEQLRTLRRGKCLIPVKGERAARIPQHLEAPYVLDLSDGSSYRERVGELARDIQRKMGAMLPRLYQVTHVMAPQLPENYVSRPADIEALRNELTNVNGPRHVAIGTHRGLSGAGKTVLAAALCRDEFIHDAFPDGVIWAGTGETSTERVTERLREIARQLGDDPTRYVSQSEAIKHFATLMKQKAALLVVDDVQSHRGVRAFLAESPRSRVLFTTRDLSGAAAVGAREYALEQLAEEKAREILAQWAGQPAGELPAEAAELVRESGRTPLALAMAGGMLRGKPREAWRETLHLVHSFDAGQVRAHFPNSVDIDCLRVLGASVNALDGEERMRYLLLGALADGMGAHPEIQKALWGAGEQEAKEQAERFVALGLAQRRGVPGEIGLHDLQLHYVRALFPDRGALELIQGAIRLSQPVISRDPRQFASQVVGRLLAYEDQDSIQAFVTLLANSAPRPWLRPMAPVLMPAGRALARTLEGHADGVYGVALSPDGRLMVSGSWDKTVRVWDLEAGRDVRVLKGHAGAVGAVAVSRDGKRVVSASWDTTLKVWDLETGRGLGTLEGHTSQVEAVALSPDGRLAVSASYDKTLKIWDLLTFKELRTITGHSDAVTAVAINAEGTRAISGSSDKTLEIWDLTSGQKIRALAGHADGVTGVALSEDGKLAVSSSWDKTLKVWDLVRGRELRTLTGHMDGVRGIAISPDGQQVASASFDSTLKVWNLKTGRELRALRGHTGAVWAVAWTPDGKRLVSASTDHTIGVWDMASEKDSAKPGTHEGWVWDVAVSPDGKRAVSAGFDNKLQVWDVRSGAVLRALAGHTGAVWATLFLRNGQWVLSGSSDGTLILWDSSEGKVIRTLEASSGSICGLAVSPDERSALAALADGNVTVWDLESNRVARTLSGHKKGVSSVAVCPDGKRAVSASFDHSLKIWHLASGQELGTLSGHTARVNRVAIGPEGVWAVSASSDKTLKVWDLGSQSEVKTLAGHSDAVYGVAASPDGRWVASASEDKTVRVWDVWTGRVVTVYTCEAPATCCRFVDSKTLIAGDSGGLVHFLALEL